MRNTNQKAVLVMSSHVARGSVGNRAAVFALETLGHPVWAIPTITLPWHPGHGLATRIVPTDDEFSNFLEDIANAAWIDELGAVLTGYMANAHQAHEAAKLIKALKQKNPDLLHICDPVIGDLGGLYVAEETANAIRSHLIPLCNIATPNAYELAWLTRSHAPSNIDEAKIQAQHLGPKSVLVTSAPAEKQTGNLFWSAEMCYLATHERIKNPPNGPGDLTAAIFAGHHLDRMTIEINLNVTTASVFEILQQSAKRGSDELTLERDAKSIIKPCAPITMQTFHC